MISKSSFLNRKLLKIRKKSANESLRRHVKRKEITQRKSSSYLNNNRRLIQIAVRKYLLNKPKKMLISA